MDYIKCDIILLMRLTDIISVRYHPNLNYVPENKNRETVMAYSMRGKVHFVLHILNFINFSSYMQIRCTFKKVGGRLHH